MNTKQDRQDYRSLIITGAYKSLLWALLDMVPVFFSAKLERVQDLNLALRQPVK